MLGQRAMMGASLRPGRLYSWGNNVSGQTAQNTNSGDTTSPTQVGSATDWKFIAAATFFSGASIRGPVTALRNDGTLWSWGSNCSINTSTVDGCIAQGSILTEVLVPTQVGTDTDWVWVSQALVGGAAIKNDGTAWSWGIQTASGNLGQGGSAMTMYTPTQIGSGTDWKRVFVGPAVIFLIKNDGTLWVAGSNSSYATGLGTNSGSTTTITQVGSATNWTYVSCNSVAMGIGLRSDGSAWSWGVDAAGELMQGSTGTYANPTRIGALNTWAKCMTSWRGASNRASYMIKTDGTLWTAGSNNGYQTGLNTNSGNTLTITQIGSALYSSFSSIGITSGAGAFLAVRRDGTLWAAGTNANYFTGMGTNTGTNMVPTQVGSLTDWKQVFCGAAGFALR